MYEEAYKHLQPTLGIAHYYITEISQYCDFDIDPFFIHFINSVFSTFQCVQCNTQTNVLGIYSFVLKLPEDGTMVLKHAGV